MWGWNSCESANWFHCARLDQSSKERSWKWKLKTYCFVCGASCQKTIVKRREVQISYQIWERRTKSLFLDNGNMHSLRVICLKTGESGVGV